MNLPNYDIAGIVTPTEGINLIHINLSHLRQIAALTDFSDRAQRESFCNNIAFIKQYYERVEVLLRDGGNFQ